MTLLTGYTPICGSLKCTQFLWVYIKARFGPPHSYDRAKKWTILYRMAGDGAQEDSDGQGDNPFMVCNAWVCSRAFTVQLVPGGSADTHRFNTKHQLHWEKDLTSWHATELRVRWLLVIPHPVCFEWSHTILLVQGKVAEVWAHWSWSVCSRLLGEAFRLLHTKGTCVHARRVAACQQRFFWIPGHDLHQDAQHGCCSWAYAYAFHGWLS